jgi:hypothetical protein
LHVISRLTKLPHGGILVPSRAHPRGSEMASFGRPFRRDASPQTARRIPLTT